MEFRLDHVVIAVDDLERAADDYRALGFTVVIGGRHPGRASRNALVVFEDGAYLEIIAWSETVDAAVGTPPTAERWYNLLRAQGEGPVDFALIPEDVPRAIAEAAARGLRMNGPIDGGRVRPDGAALKWQTGRQLTFDLPFLCGDITPRELRVPEGEARAHANGARGVGRVTVAVKDIAASLERYGALLGRMPATPRFRVGNTEIALVPTSGAGNEGPCALTLVGARVSGTLDRALTHATPIEISPVLPS